MFCVENFHSFVADFLSLDKKKVISILDKFYEDDKRKQNLRILYISDIDQKLYSMFLFSQWKTLGEIESINVPYIIPPRIYLSHCTCNTEGIQWIHTIQKNGILRYLEMNYPIHDISNPLFLMLYRDKLLPKTILWILSERIERGEKYNVMFIFSYIRCSPSRFINILNMIIGKTCNNNIIHSIHHSIIFPEYQSKSCEYYNHKKI
jgi:hypothetical protein